MQVPAARDDGAAQEGSSPRSCSGHSALGSDPAVGV